MPSEPRHLSRSEACGNAGMCSAAEVTLPVPISDCILVWEPQRKWTEWKSTGPAEQRNRSTCRRWTALTLLWKEKGSSNGEALFRESIPTQKCCVLRIGRSFCECFSYYWVFDRQSGTNSDDQRGFRSSRNICRRHSTSWRQFSTSGLAYLEKIFAGDNGFRRRAF